MERGKARAFANLPENKGVRGRADGRAPAGEPRAQPPLVRPEPQVGPGAALPLRCDLRLRPGAARGPAGIGARVRGTAAEREPEHNPASGGREGAATCRPNAEAVRGVPSSERAGRPGVGKPNRAAPGNGSLRGCDSLKYFSPRPRRLRPSEGTGKAQLRNAAPFVSALSRRPRPEGAPRSGERSARPRPGTQRAPRI